ncbi:Ribosomal protein S2 [Vibrio vulnificus]|uniref:Ribosomal protein S2 n=1 Tax=Vibrio vulnificus TaxID=672 RepID=A0AAN1PTI1_VIBVL|nr:Ribosomal protein S2 [Vibrio vulnificus]ARN68560.1 Ribosomal protein S2 [Vibrio vulnificus]ASC59657.1 Ribosomal protein S2 [Vibrio vulnificus]AXX62435.1 Ribosomal protein S2 [Vibrio vulnificus]
MNKVRVINYQETVHRLNADIIALQEVRDRYALERFSHLINATSSSTMKAQMT